MHRASLAELQKLRDTLQTSESAHNASVRGFSKSVGRHMAQVSPAVKTNAPTHALIKKLAVMVDDGLNPAYKAGEVHMYADRCIFYTCTSNGNLVNPQKFPACKSFSWERMHRCVGCMGNERVYSRRMKG